MQTKKCSRCGKLLPITDFYVKYKTPKIKYYSECKSCRLEITTKYSKTPKAILATKKYYQNNKNSILLRQQNYYRNNTDHVKEIKNRWLMNNVEKNKEVRKKSKTKVREAFLNMYGNKCVCCGETIYEFLTLEHKLGQKGVKRSYKKSGQYAYAEAIKEYRPDLYEVLCWNCNCAKGRYGYCPHQNN